jgi:hypothetical protein
VSDFLAGCGWRLIESKASGALKRMIVWVEPKQQPRARIMCDSGEYRSADFLAQYFWKNVKVVATNAGHQELPYPLTSRPSAVSRQP